jgi:hypothetical protein
MPLKSISDFVRKPQLCAILSQPKGIERSFKADIAGPKNWSSSKANK